MSLVPVYQFHNTQGSNGLLRYFYTTLGPKLDGTSWNSVPSDDVNNWICDGIAFYGCGQSDPGAVAFNQWSAPEGGGSNLPKGPSDSQKYIYQPASVTSAGFGWNPDCTDSTGPAFWAYGGQDGGLAQFMIYYTASPEYNYGLFCNLASAVTGNLAVPSGWQGAEWYTPGQQPWLFYALPGQTQLAYALQGIYIEPPPPGTGEPALVGTQMVTNNSKCATVSQNISFTLALTSSFTLTFTETLNVSNTMTMGVTVSIPGMGSVNASNSLTVGISLSSSQAQTVTTQQTVLIASTVTIPPNSAITATGNVYVVQDYSPPNNPITIAVDMSPESNGVLLSQVYAAPTSATCTALTDLFMTQNPSFTGTVTPNQPGPGSIEVSLSCAITANFGVNTELVVADSAG
jgi:Clostridium epsilon toxin ETX/Bacillus mosquitocidal toxin MTX2